MIANAFSNSKYNIPKSLIFASGVSNSKSNDDREFEREIRLLKNYLNNDERLIYFSTSSIYDNYLKSSPYVKHKLFVENFITSNFKNFIIYRLPNVIGKTKNKNTMINFFKECIINKKPVNLDKNSRRYIIDVDDVVKYVYLTQGFQNCIFNINFNINYSIVEIWSEIENALNKKGKFKIIQSGMFYKVDNSFFVDCLGESNIAEINDKDYLKKTVKKYFFNL